MNNVSSAKHVLVLNNVMDSTRTSGLKFCATFFRDG